MVVAIGRLQVSFTLAERGEAARGFRRAADQTERVERARRRELAEALHEADRARWVSNACLRGWWLI